MKVKITNIEDDSSYIAKSETNCKDKTDLSGYKTCVSLNDMITIGKVIFEPIYKGE